MFMRGVVFICAAASLINGEGQLCEILEARAAQEDQNTIVDTSSKQLFGTWISEGCEIRPGPQFILRSYAFKEDGTFRLIQHHYWDDSCSSPKLTVTSHGLLRLKLGALFNSDASNGYVRQINVSVTPRDGDACAELDRIVSSECPGIHWKSWKKHEEYLVYEEDPNRPHYNSFIRTNFKYIRNGYAAPHQFLQSAIPDVSCLKQLKLTFNELKLLKIQLRPEVDDLNEDVSSNPMRLELLLGDMHSDTTHQENYVPTAFQVPLCKYTKDNTIRMNKNDYRIKKSCSFFPMIHSYDKSPPHLIKKPHLPPFIWGEWISARCEIRPFGLYLTRRFSFHPGNVWAGDHKFYMDPHCAIPKFTVTASGYFKLGGANSLMQSATDADIGIERVALTIFDRKMSEDMARTNACGTGNWRVDAPRDLGDLNGCLQFGIALPSVRHEIVKFEINYEGASLLYLGQSETDILPRVTRRPTAFQEPLVKCVSNDAVFYEQFYFNCCNILIATNDLLIFSFIIAYFLGCR